MKTVDWGLQQGLLGATQQTLSPSLSSLGPNRYLTRDDFLRMLLVALVVHALIVVVASLFSDDSVKDIPVRALSFKIGDSDGAVTAPRMVVAAPIMPPKPIAALLPVAQPQRSAPTAVKAPPMVKAAPTSQFDIPMPRPSLPQTPLSPPPAAALPSQPLPDPALLSQPAVAMNPQRFIREADASQTGAAHAAENAQAARARYELAISGWIQKHKLYPPNANGAEGRVVVRMRIDRTGNVRYYGIEDASGNAVLDNAAIDMIRRANPMPVVPDDYPAGSLVEFLIPISFKVPQ